MRGEQTEEMDAAWRRYLDDRGESRGWNPRKLFDAGWTAKKEESDCSGDEND